MNIELEILELRKRVEKLEDITQINLNRPNVIELMLPDTTYLQPGFGREKLYDQVPPIDRERLDKIMRL